MTRQVWGCAGLAVLLTLGGAAARAADEDKPVTDEEFVRKVSTSDLAEFRLAKMAMEQAASPVVKDFAKRVMEDHTKSSKELMSVASKTGLAVSKELDKKHQALVDKMATLQGAAFDREY